MTEPSPSPDTGDDAGADPDRGATAGLAGWQKVAGIIGLLVILVVAIMLFAGGGHGPGRHGVISPNGEGAIEITVTANGASDPDAQGSESVVQDVRSQRSEGAN